MKKLNERLRELRESNNYTQPAIADALELNLKAYQAYEEDRSTPSIFTIDKLAKFYGISIDELLHGRLMAMRKTPFDAYYRLPLEKRKIVDFILNQ